MDISRSSPTTLPACPAIFSFLKKRGRGGRRGGKNFEGRDEIFNENFPFPITDLFVSFRENSREFCTRLTCKFTAFDEASKPFKCELESGSGR